MIKKAENWLNEVVKKSAKAIIQQKKGITMQFENYWRTRGEIDAELTRERSNIFPIDLEKIVAERAWKAGFKKGRKENGVQAVIVILQEFAKTIQAETEKSIMEKLKGQNREPVLRNALREFPENQNTKNKGKPNVKIGDKVKISPIIKDPKEKDRHPTVVSEMIDLIGKTGVITAKSLSGNTYSVSVGKGGSWSYRQEWLIPVTPRKLNLIPKVKANAKF